MYDSLCCFIFNIFYATIYKITSDFLADLLFTSFSDALSLQHPSSYNSIQVRRLSTV